MKAGIYNPYLDTLGGGERYCLTFAEVLLKSGWRVDMFWPDSAIKLKLSEKFGLDLRSLNFVDYSPVKKSYLTRFLFESEYDLLFYVSDGSLPLMFGKKNWLHFQVPFTEIKKSWLIDKIKLAQIDQIVCNSLFTQRTIAKSLNHQLKVIYPPVDVAPLRPLKKENIILSVGRFSQLLQGKRQDILVEIFKDLVDKGKLKNWKLILAGGSEIGAKVYLATLKNEINDYPIEIKENILFKDLLDLYGRAKIFWLASGYDVDEIANPEKVEHFGMTTVEAMAAGVIPLVLAKGGQKEIIEERENGFFWQTKEDLIRQTLKVITDKKLMQKISENAILKSKQFSKERFYQDITNLLTK